MVAPEFLTLADDPALDFLNTVTMGESALIDHLETDSDVVAWVQMMGFLDEDFHVSFKRGALLQAARSLRDVIRKLVIQRKSGKRVDVAALNSFLIHGRYKTSLVRGSEGRLEVVQEHEKSTPEQVLTGVAQAAAELLAEGDFDLIRKCESSDCVLWFYDKTKAHRRRWCSMALCGNRHKVANFRARKREEVT
jgi:predicted RNA-binding Zn ribbon-like protein